MESRVRSPKARRSSAGDGCAGGWAVCDSGGDCGGACRRATTPDATDWAQIVALYDLLLRVVPSPVVELNRAVAVAMRDGPAAGLELIDAILDRGELADYHLAYAARADLCRRLGRTSDARAAYEQALALVEQEPERRFLEGRLAELA